MQNNIIYDNHHDGEINYSYSSNSVQSVLKTKHNSELSSENDIQIKEVKFKQEKELTLWSKLSFAFAGAPYQMYFSAIGVFANVFLLEKAQLKPDKIGYILFISRLIDAITDPLYGYFVHKSKSTKYGRMKPWIIWSFPISALSYIMMWYIPSGFDETQLFIWFLVWHSLLFTFLTGVRIPHTSMTMFLTKSQAERQSATVFRMGFEMFGILLALAIQSPFVNSPPCQSLNNTDNNTLYVINSNIITKTLNNTTTSDFSFFDDQKYVIFAAINTLVFITGNMLLILFVKEIDVVDLDKQSTKRKSTWSECRRIFSFRPYLILLSAFVLNQLAIQSLQANIQIYFEYGYYAIKGLFTEALLSLLTLAVLFVPIWQFLMKKVGKKKSFFLGNMAIVPLLVACLFFRTDALYEVVLFFLFIAFAANSFTAAFLVPWAILPVCLDAYYLKYKSRPDALFYTFFLLGTKVMISFYLFITQLVLGQVGYQTGLCAEFQKESVSDAIRYMFAPIPIVLVILSSLIISFFPIDEKMALENTEKIQKLKEIDDNEIVVSPMPHKAIYQQADLNNNRYDVETFELDPVKEVRF